MLKNYTKIVLKNFTPREIDILSCLLSGRSVKHSAKLFEISIHTVDTHIRHIMDKLNCRSRSEIIDVIENSNIFSHIKSHYAKLLSKSHLKNLLADIKHKDKANMNIQVIKTNIHDALFDDITQKLKQVCTMNSKMGYDYIIEFSNKNIEIRTVEKVIGTFNLSDVKNSDLVVCNIFKYMFANSLIHTLIESCIQKISSIYLGSPVCHSSTSSKNSSATKGSTDKSLNNKIIEALNSYRILILLVTVLVFCTLSVLFIAKNKTTPTTRSDFIMPTNSNILNRPQLIKKIDSKFNNKKTIQTVVIVGIGGSGKSTLARLYAKTQQNHLFWEINAETQESLLASFDLLAYAISNLEEKKQEIKIIKNILNTEERIKKLVLFVQKKMYHLKNWGLVFDNVDKFSDIKAFFPNNSQVWGCGKIIITTRNQHLKNSPAINPHNVIEIAPLNDKEKSTLFSKIFGNDKKIPNSFLKHIPNFPLDISIAAHYIKNTHMPFEDYVEQMKSNSRAFEKVQSNFLIETREYSKTRYSIITSSLKKIIETNSEFVPLFMLMGILDAENISKKLLADCKNSAITDVFIHNIVKHSLVSYEGNNSTLCIHRSTQEIIWLFLNQFITSDKKKKYLLELSKAIEKHIDTQLSSNSVNKKRIFIRHLLRILEHDINPHVRGIIEAQLARSYCYLGDFKNGKIYLNQALSHLDFSSYSDRARALSYLSMIEREKGLRQAMVYINECLDIYKKHILPSKTCTSYDLGAYAWSLQAKGIIYWYTCHFEKSISLIQRSQSIYTQLYGIINENSAAGLCRLGNVYCSMGKYQKAKKNYNQSLKMYKEIANNKKNNTPNLSKCVNSPDSTYRETLVHVALGVVNYKMGNYSVAQQLLEQSCDQYEKNYPLTYGKLSIALMHLGNTYRVQGYYKKAEKTLERSLKMRIKYLGKDNFWSMQSALQLGKLYLDTKNYVKAKNLIEEAFIVYEKTFDKTSLPRAWVLYYLAKTYRMLKDFDLSAKLLKECLPIYEKNYGRDHMKTKRIINELNALSTEGGSFCSRIKPTKETQF